MLTRIENRQAARPAGPRGREPDAHDWPGEVDTMPAQVIELAVRPPARSSTPSPHRRVGPLVGWGLVLALGVGAGGFLDDLAEVMHAILTRYGAFWVALGGVALLGLTLVRRRTSRRERAVRGAEPTPRRLTLVTTEARR